jgi:lipoyl(octanoyl) transferase
LNTCHLIDVGLIEYSDAWALQKRLVSARKANAIDDVLLLCEHAHVITLGRNAKREHLLASEHVLKQKGVSCTRPTAAGTLPITDRDRLSAIRY